MTSNKKPAWIARVTLVGIMTFIGFVLGFLNDALDLRDRFFHKEHPTPTPQPTAILQDDPVLSTFPFFVGNTWEYSYGTRTDANQGENQTIDETGNYTARVINVETGYSGRIRIYYIEISRPASNYAGMVFNAPCGSQGNASITYMIVTDGASLYEVCDRETLLDVAFKLAAGEKITSSGPTFVLPLVEGALWPYYPNDPPRDDTAYQWYVETKLDKTVPAGNFTDCYRIIFRTNPDATINFVCPGIGIVASEYHHYGSIVDYTAELTSYDFVNQPK